MENELKIKIFRDEHHFAAAHFLAGMGKCERLHGHNYSVTVEVGGEPNENGAIIDFNEINPMIAKLCAQLDHKMIIAGEENRFTLNRTSGEVEVMYKDKRYVFPESDCVILPTKSTTVEALARYMCGLLGEQISTLFPNIRWIETGVREGSAQMGVYRLWL